MKELLFVYGTLMQGQPNHRVLVEIGARFASAATTRGLRTIVDLGPYPALLRFDAARDATRVPGELYEIAEGDLEKLDAFEGSPDLYVRERIEIATESGPVEAWTYVLASEVPLNATLSVRLEHVQHAYDRTAAAYVAKFGDELAGKPIDRGLLNAFAELVRGGRVLELGCGPGQVGRYLFDRGVQVEGIDISPEMIAAARATHPAMIFRTGNMLALEEADASVRGIVAFYAIVHLSPPDVALAAREWARVLAPGGFLLMSFHVGSERVHVEDFLGAGAALDFQLHDRDAVEAALERASLTVEARLERRGDPAVEHPSLRAYLLAKR